MSQKLTIGQKVINTLLVPLAIATAFATAVLYGFNARYANFVKFTSDMTAMELLKIVVPILIISHIGFCLIMVRAKGVKGSWQDVGLLLLVSAAAAYLGFASL